MVLPSVSFLIVELMYSLCSGLVSHNLFHFPFSSSLPPSHTGTLCGTCVNGTSVGVLRTNCRSCEKDNYYALGFLGESSLLRLYLDLCNKTLGLSCLAVWHSTVVGDIILVGVVLFAAMKLKLVFPHSLKGLLFYVQTAYYTTEYFPISFWDIRKYVSLYIAGIRLTMCVWVHLSMYTILTAETLHTICLIYTLLSIVLLFSPSLPPSLPLSLPPLSY